MSGRSAATAALLTLHVGLLLHSSWVHSPNDLEANLLPAGYVHLRYGRFDIAQVNPPFSRMLCALPLLAFDVDENWAAFESRPDLRVEYAFGRDFMLRNVEQLQPMLLACRAVAVLFSLLGAVCVGRIGSRLYGERAGLAALTLWCCCPLALGHAATVNHDVPGAALLAATLLGFLVWGAETSALATVGLGALCGVTLLTRTVCGPPLALLIVCRLCGRGPVRVAGAGWMQRTA